MLTVFAGRELPRPELDGRTMFTVPTGMEFDICGSNLAIVIDAVGLNDIGDDGVWQVSLGILTAECARWLATHEDNGYVHARVRHLRDLALAAAALEATHLYAA
jgi:hypothetical protein